MNNDLQRIAPPKWDGSERTTFLQRGGEDEATPLSIAAVTPVAAATTGNASTGSSWTGADVTAPLGASIPVAHLNITAQFAPFIGRKPGRGAPAGTPPDAPDVWHLAGRTGALTGQAFGDYELGGILGEGGMGVIYRARQRSLGRRVAVKTLSSGVGQDPIQRGRFEIEARAAGLIRSPHVVQVHAAGSHNDTAYFVMEYVDGQHLGEILAEHTQQQRLIVAERVVQWMLHAARGLAAAAQHGVVHRDIKPSNLLISHEVLKIADFGISRIQGESQLTRTGTAIGTPSYVSPEQGRGDVCDARSDVYSLGVVFYECLTGHKPFVGDTANAVIYQHCYSEPRLPRDVVAHIPEHWQAVVMRCLQKSPDNRYQSANELVFEIERIQSGNVSLTAMFNARYGTGADEAMRHYQGRGRWWVVPAIAASLLATVTCLGGGWWWLSQADERAAERRSGELLRGELRYALDIIAPLPVSAVADIERLSAVVGTHDPDVRRWRAQVRHIQELMERCGRIDQATFLEATVFHQATADVEALTHLIGKDFPAHARWAAHLAANANEIQRLRTVLRPLDAHPWVSMAEQAATAGDRARYASLAGTLDADLMRWNERIASSLAQQALLQAQLQKLDDTTYLVTEAEARKIAEQLLDYHKFCGSDRPDVDAARWRATLVAHDQRLQTLRIRLASLDNAALIPSETLAHLAKELVSYSTFVLQDDANKVRWSERLTAHNQALAQLHEQCGVLDHPRDLTGEQLITLRQDVDLLRPLVSSDNPQVRLWNTTLVDIESALRRDQEAVARLERHGVEAKQPLSLAHQRAAMSAITHLEHRVLLKDSELLSYRQHLLVEQELFAQLKDSLKIADSPDVELTTSLVDDVLLYGRLADADDVDYRRWYGRVVKAVQLRDGLSVLDSPHPVPSHARELLAEYVAIFGEEDRRAVMWRKKIDRVNELNTMLMVLDHATAAPVDGDQRLSELLELIGPFTGSESWRLKLSQIALLHQQLTSELNVSQVHLQPQAKEHLTRLGVLEGVAGPAVQTWTKRLAWMVGPGRPGWATGYRVDALGPCAEITLPGEPSLTISYRYLPPSSSFIGSHIDEEGRDHDETPVMVTRTRGCWLAEHECNQAIYERIVGQTPSAHGNAEFPVERVSWADTAAFFIALQRVIPAFPARLPREAEWEHAARAGSLGPWQGPRGGLPESDLEQVAWCVTKDSSSNGSHPVGRRKPNELGLFDMHGNVWEWCADRYGPYSPVPITDPLGVETDLRVARGGSWGDYPIAVRAANRLAVDPGLRSAYLGFRIACTADIPPEVRLEIHDAAEPSESPDEGPREAAQ